MEMANHVQFLMFLTLKQFLSLLIMIGKVLSKLKKVQAVIDMQMSVGPIGYHVSAILLRPL